MAVGEAGVAAGDGAVSVSALPRVRSWEQRWRLHTMVTGTAIPIMAMAMDTRTVMATDIRTTAVTQVTHMATAPAPLMDIGRIRN
jgi:hypothetical protein